MFDIFGIRARIKAKKEAREAEELAKAQEKKRIYQERKILILEYRKKYFKEQEKIIEDLNKKRKERLDLKNSHCPRCKSSNVITKISRTKGEVHGDEYSSSYLSSGLFGSSYSSHSHSNIDGEVDTLPINRCKDCGHEWYAEVYEPYEVNDIFSTYNSFLPGFLYRKIDEYLNLEYDPKDTKEECNSLEEKKNKFIEKYSTLDTLEPYRTVPRYMIETSLCDEILNWRSYYVDRINKLFNFNVDEDDQYSYIMSDELWKIVKKLIGWKGTE